MNSSLFSDLVPEIAPDATREQKYSHALGLVRLGIKSVHGAAIETGLDPANFRKKLIRLSESIPSGEKLHQASEERILVAAEELAEAAAEKLLEKVDGDLRAAELTKMFSAAAGVVSAKRRWSQATDSGNDRTQDALAGALQRLRDGDQIQIVTPDPIEKAITVNPIDTNSSDEPRETTGAQ